MVSVFFLTTHSHIGKIMVRTGKKFCYHIGIVCVTCPNLLKMGIQIGAMKSLGRILGTKMANDDELTCYLIIGKVMMASSNGNIFHVTGLLFGEFTDHWWIPLTKASDTELWCFLWSVPEQMIE